MIFETNKYYQYKDTNERIKTLGKCISWLNGYSLHIDTNFRGSLVVNYDDTDGWKEISEEIYNLEI